MNRVEFECNEFLKFRGENVMVATKNVILYDL